MAADQEDRPEQESVLRGIGVSEGIAIAPLYSPSTAYSVARWAGTPCQEAKALRKALGDAIAALEVLASGMDEEAAAILEFQIALLDDEDMLAPVFAAIEAGTAADEAWLEVMGAEIAAYREGEDPVFAARAADLEDLRDRVLDGLAGVTSGQRGPTQASIVVSADLAPSRFLEMDPSKVAGIALGQGSRTSHVALLARARGVPMLAGLGCVQQTRLAAQAVMDVSAGTLVLNPSEQTLLAARQSALRLAAARKHASTFIAQTIRWRNRERINVCVNIDHESLLSAVQAEHCDGIGLARTEFLFENGPPGEEAQLAVYGRLIEWAQGRPVTIRTLDAGGDKPVPGLEQSPESNPFLGLRGVRLSLSRSGLFKTQLKALLRASKLGTLKIMIPMVTEPAELAAVKRLLDEARQELAAAGVGYGQPALGMMVEVPAAALCADQFETEFYSIGTNDLIQYATASARDNAAVAHLARGDHPGVVAMIEAVVAAGLKCEREVSVCGDMASNPEDACRLMKLGVRTLSVAPAMLGPVKAALALAAREGR